MKIKLFTFLVIIVGSLIWSLTMVKSGLCIESSCNTGIGFWGPNGHDGIWHISLINSLSQGNLQMPVFAGEKLSNYHIGFDLILASIKNVTKLPSSVIYFQIFPPIAALAIGLLTYTFVFRWRKSKIEALCSTFFVYFGGGFGWVVTLIRSNEISGESMFWSQQTVSTLINPPFAMSLIILLLGLILLLKLKDKFSVLIALIAILLFGILFEIKAYAGVLALGSLAVVGVFDFLKTKNYRLLLIFVGAFTITSLLYVFLNNGAAGLLVWQPFWFIETMMGLSDRFNWPKFYEAMLAYKSGHVVVKGIVAYFSAFAIFVIGNMGTRILSLYRIKGYIGNKSKIDLIDVFASTLISAGIILPMFFVQKGTPWNTIQFFYYSLFFSSILTGVVVAKLFQKRKSLHIALALLIVVFTIPTTWGTMRDVYLPPRPPAMVSNAELDALKYLSTLPRGTVLTGLFDKQKAIDALVNPPRPLYLYESTAYVSAYSEQPVYMADEVNLDITGYDWRVRRNKVEDFLNTLDHVKVRSFLIDNNISYIYWIKGERARLGETQLGLKNIFENNSVTIYEVVK